MPNYKPLAIQQGVTTAAGGILVREDVRETLQTKVLREAAALSMADVQRLNTNRASWPVYLGRATAGFVGEGAPKPVTGAEFGQLLIDIKKMATIVVYTEELLEDAASDPTVLVNDDVESAFADLIDAHLLGVHPGGASTQGNFTTSFNAALLNSAMVVELGNTGGDRLALAVSDAMERIEMQGYNPNGMIASLGAKRALRDARDTTGQPLYRPGFQGTPDSIEGLSLRYSTNLPLDSIATPGLVGGAGSPGKTVAIVGDFNNLKVAMRKDMSTKVLDQATIDMSPALDGSQLHHLAQRNEIAVRWEMRMGAQIFEPARAFVRIVNAA